MGTANRRRLYPRISTAFDLYLACRSIQFVHYELAKDHGRKVEHKTVPFVAGYGSLPEAGGMLDQPCWTIQMFDIFRAGENNGARKLLR